MLCILGSGPLSLPLNSRVPQWLVCPVEKSVIAKLVSRHGLDRLAVSASWDSLLEVRNLPALWTDVDMEMGRWEECLWSPTFLQVWEGSKHEPSQAHWLSADCCSVSTIYFTRDRLGQAYPAKMPDHIQSCSISEQQLFQILSILAVCFAILQKWSSRAIK